MRSPSFIARLRDEAGMTVIELMVGFFLSSLVVFAALSMLDSASRHERGQQERHAALLELRSAGDRITKDLRQALVVHETSTQNRLAIETFVTNGSDTPVRMGVVYTVDLGAGTVTRTECTALSTAGTCATGAPLTIVKEALPFESVPVFCYGWVTEPTPNCALTTPPAGDDADPLTAIRVTLARAPEIGPGQPVVLATDVDLRNA
jgi:Tfp pilus assembly protein PilW